MFAEFGEIALLEGSPLFESGYQVTQQIQTRVVMLANVIHGFGYLDDS